MLDTVHDTEFYIEIAEDHDLLEQILGGETSLEAEMDYFLRKMELTDCTKNFKDYLSLLKDLGAIYLDTTDLEKRCKALIWGELQNVGYVFGLGAVTLGGILLAVPPFTIAEPLIVAAGGGLAAALHKNQDYIQDTKKRKHSIFDPVCDLAEHYDRDIGRAFMLDDLIHRRERFGITYRNLSYGERAFVNEELVEYLEAGILEIGSLELEQYLDSVMEEE